MAIGKLKMVPDIRKVWEKETDFSDWLVTEDGIAFLADELGFEIENAVRESRPGDYPCDVAGNILGEEDHMVVIENQYGKSNHDHLGKLLTYAAVHKATTGIWITERVSDDHRQVIDWLNESTPESVNLYLAALKVFRIGDSTPAPKLDIVCRPNLTVKASKSGLSQSDLIRYEWRKGMWEGIHEAIEAKNPPFRLQAPGIHYWSTISIGRQGFQLNMLLVPLMHEIRIELLIKVPWEQKAFQVLEAQKHEIEAEVGERLQWQAKQGKKTSAIVLETKIDSKDEKNREQVQQWFAEKSLIMYKAFKDRVAALVPPED